jgi:hypothetical protein
VFCAPPDLRFALSSRRFFMQLVPATAREYPRPAASGPRKCRTRFQFKGLAFMTNHPWLGAKPLMVRVAKQSYCKTANGTGEDFAGVFTLEHAFDERESTMFTGWLLMGRPGRGG